MDDRPDLAALFPDPGTGQVTFGHYEWDVAVPAPDSYGLLRPVLFKLGLQFKEPLDVQLGLLFPLAGATDLAALAAIGMLGFVVLQPARTEEPIHQLPVSVPWEGMEERLNDLDRAGYITV